jgi:hypothetical protein
MRNLMGCDKDGFKNEVDFYFSPIMRGIELTTNENHRPIQNLEPMKNCFVRYIT